MPCEQAASVWIRLGVGAMKQPSRRRVGRCQSFGMASSSISSINTSVPSGSHLSDLDNASEVSQELTYRSKEGFAAAAEALLRDVDAKLVKELRGGSVVDPRQQHTQALQREIELRTELSHMTVRNRELEQKASDLWHAVQEAKNGWDQARGANARLAQNLSEATREVERLRGHVTQSEKRSADLQSQLQRSEYERNNFKEMVNEHQTVLAAQQATMAQLRNQLDRERLETREKMAAKDREKEMLLEEQRGWQVRNRSLEEYHGASVTLQTKKLAELEVQVDRLTRQFESTKTELQCEKGGVEHYRSRCNSLEQELASSENSRRELHNTIQELKGNIRVFCRVRPAQDASENAVLLPAPNRLLVQHCGEAHRFDLDMVFGTGTGQADVFNEVDGLVQSALDGYKVCIFAYGQTGTGKTYTMLGTSVPGTSGLIPRSLNKIFQASAEMKSKGWSWSLQASFMEIYNEGLRDLLRGGGDAAGGPAPGSGHTIVHHEAWGTKVTNMTCVEVNSMEQIAALMERAGKQRAVGATDMNAVSSRSHSIFALYLQGSNAELGIELTGALHLVDLAGSERLAKSGSTGERLKETQSINKSLSSLVDVFAAKAEGRAHIPFRNSKLTHLMEPCLSGQGKTLMLVHIGPEQGNAHESLCTLRFAKQVNQCDTGGKPKRNVRSTFTARGSTSSVAKTDVLDSTVDGMTPLTSRTPRRSSWASAVSYNAGRSRSASVTRRSRSPT